MPLNALVLPTKRMFAPMKILTLFILLVFVFLGHPSYGGPNQFLAKIDAFKITDIVLPPNTDGTGVSESSIRTCLELTLRRNNIPLSTADYSDYIEPRIMIQDIGDGTYVFVANLRVWQPVNIPFTFGPDAEFSRAITWDSHLALGSSSDRSRVGAMLNEILEGLASDLANDWLAAQPPKRSSSSSSSLRPPESVTHAGNDNSNPLYDISGVQLDPGHSPQGVGSPEP